MNEKTKEVDMENIIKNQDLILTKAYRQNKINSYMIMEELEKYYARLYDRGKIKFNKKDYHHLGDMIKYAKQFTETEMIEIAMNIPETYYNPLFVVYCTEEKKKGIWPAVHYFKNDERLNNTAKEILKRIAQLVNDDYDAQEDYKYDYKKIWVIITRMLDDFLMLITESKETESNEDTIDRLCAQHPGFGIMLAYEIVYENTLEKAEEDKKEDEDVV